VRREILGAHIRFGLNDAPDALRATVVVDEMQANELARNEECVLASIEGAGEFFSGHVA
jgi:hypothetical protein